MQIETVCMKYQTLFSGKNKKNTISLSSEEQVQRVVKINLYFSAILVLERYFRQSLSAETTGSFRL